jgi:hypothetical protein
VTDVKPSIATNRPGELVADAIRARLEHWRTEMVNPPEVAVATAYFNPGGYALLADELDHPARVRLLLGAEPDPPVQRVRSLRESVSRVRAERSRLDAALRRDEGWLAEERNLLGFSVEADATCRRLVKWLETPGVEVRRLGDRFLHGKAFIIESDDDSVLVGSSNFTYAGLSQNAELNLAHYDAHPVRLVGAWFDELWDEATPYDLADVYRVRFVEHSPWDVYLRMLLAVYGRDLDEDAAIGRALHLAPFQRAGVVRALRVLDERDGVLIADDVGLGKTFVAGEIIARFVRDLRQRAIVVAPAVLRDGPWRRFLFDHQLPVELVSYEELRDDRALQNDPAVAAGAAAHLQARSLDEYGLVVIDEAHNLRNPATQRSEALRRLLAGTPRKKVVLLTATPVNNSLLDVYHLLRFFIFDDAAFRDRGVLSMKARFDEAMDKDPEDLTANDLFEVLDAVAVRRTRAFVRKYHPNDRIFFNGEWQTIRFPTPRPIQVDYNLEDAYPGLLGRLDRALDGYEYGRPCPDGVLSMARYMPSLYRHDNLAARKGESFEIQNGGLLRSALLKRFESSAVAFAATCRKMAAGHDGMLELLASGKVPTGRALSEWMASDLDSEEFEEALGDVEGAELEDAADYNTARLRGDLERDRDLLLEWATVAEAVSQAQDPKLARLVDELAVITEQASAESVDVHQARDRRKVLIFSYYADTVHWIVEHLQRLAETDARLAPYEGRIAHAVGREHTNEAVMFGFAPKTTDPPEAFDHDRFDIVVATDVLAEGVNLQQARHIISYDLPWNPMRLVQRHGRIDRIGSEHSEVFLRCIYPDRQLDSLLELEQRLRRKLRHALVTFGGRAPLPGFQDVDLTYADTTARTLAGIKAGDNHFFTTEGGTVLGEEFRQLLRSALEVTGTRARLEALPWAIGSGFARPGDEPAWVFCAQIADHPEVQLRYVTRDADGSWVVDDNQLRCLLEARPDAEADTPRILADGTYTDTYAAWAAARSQIAERWEHATDPANLAPKIPATMQRAIALVQDHFDGVMTVEEADTLVDRLRAPYPERMLRPMRDAMRDGEPQDQVQRIRSLADALGFQAGPRPEPYPPINDEDVHLLCWLAIVPPQA